MKKPNNKFWKSLMIIPALSLEKFLVVLLKMKGHHSSVSNPDQDMLALK